MPTQHLTRLALHTSAFTFLVLSIGGQIHALTITTTERAGAQLEGGLASAFGVVGILLSVGALSVRGDK